MSTVHVGVQVHESTGCCTHISKRTIRVQVSGTYVSNLSRHKYIHPTKANPKSERVWCVTNNGVEDRKNESTKQLCFFVLLRGRRDGGAQYLTQ